MTTDLDLTKGQLLKSEILSLYQDWLAEIESLLRHTTKWANRLLIEGQIEQGSQVIPVMNIQINLANKLLMRLPEFMQQIQTEISLTDLYDMLVEIRSGIFGIESSAEMFRKSYFGQLHPASGRFVAKIIRYSEILYMLAKEAEPFLAAEADRQNK